jgi:hypothetical protein
LQGRREEKRMQVNIPLTILLSALIITSVILIVFYKRNNLVILKRWIWSGLIAVFVTAVNIVVPIFTNPNFLIAIILYSSFLFVALPIFEYLQKKDLLFLLQKILFISIFVVAFIELQFKIQHEIIDVVLAVIIVAFVFVSILTIKENIESIKERLKNPPWRRS